MSQELMQALMGMNTGVPVPQGQPIQPSMNPMMQMQQAGAISPASTPAPQQTYNSAPQAKSLEELLFGMGAKPYGN